ncbi:MAG: cell surface protein SprA [Bacteroidia bacterium]|nr:cell surface protein SprA [Bacteroidia bacterium]
MSKFSIALLVSAIVSLFYTQPESSSALSENYFTDKDSLIVKNLDPENDTSKVKKNPNDHAGDPTQQKEITPMHLDYPGSYKVIYELEDSLTGYNIYEKMGNIDMRRPSHISFDDYVDYRLKELRRNHFREMADAASGGEQDGLSLDINIEELSDIFGGGTISIRPTGFATLRFSIDRNVSKNPQLSSQLQKITLFNFDQNIQVGVIGQIGERLRMNVNFDTQATFDFEDELKLEHNGTEDQILQNIAAGNVSMQVGNSLIVGRQNLLGLKTTLKFGPVYVSGIASIEQGQVQTLKVAGGGAVETPFEKEVTEYDANRHFFLNHYFRSQYETALQNLPVIQSRLQIQQVEVWVERQGFTRDNRNALALVDLGENDNPGQGRIYNPTAVTSEPSQPFPGNDANDLYQFMDDLPGARDVTSAQQSIESLVDKNFVNTEDYEVVSNMRKLQANEYTINSALGYISLNTPIQSDQVLCVAYRYTLNGQVYQVGDLSNDVPANAENTNVLFLKMLKPSVLRVGEYPAWDLMMKNIYQIQYGINRDGFFLDVKYESGTSAGKINYLPEGPVKDKPLIQVLNIDRLTNHTAPGPDNFFDFVEPFTILPQRGLVIFPVLEPFGSHLESKLQGDEEAIEQYVFRQLYSNTQASARQNGPQFRYSLEGYFRSSSNAEIPLNTFNLSEGGVIVRAGGRQLTEGTDYRIDQIAGKIIITNEAILTSNQDIEVSFESSSLYRLQNKTLLGSRIEYSPSQDLSLGGTILNLREQPFNNKTILGDEPVNNTLWGFDGTYDREAPFLTKVLDKLPFYTTKASSQITAAGEFAQFLPGVPRAIRNSTDRGIVYLDDFEAAATPFTLMGWQRWKVATYPEGNDRLFDPRELYTSPLAENYSRAKLSWYTIDQIYYNRWRNRVPEEDQNSNYTRQITPNEIFPTAQRAFGSQLLQPTFDLRYNPLERGFYNFQVDKNRVEPNGNFSNPEENWAGIMRSIDVNNDFEATNVEFVEFWLMDPFDPTDGNPASQGGELYFNLGLVDEDVLPDGRLFREHALPNTEVPTAVTLPDTTFWGPIVNNVPAAETFANDPQARLLQDVGLDGLPSDKEAIFYENVIDTLTGYLTPQALAKLSGDPSSDDYRSFRDPFYDSLTAPLLDRYEFWNGMEGNSPTAENNTNTEESLQSTNRPDIEDVNRNGSLNQSEQYWQYRIRLHPDSLEPGNNFVVDQYRTPPIPVGQGTREVTWYQIRIPIRAGTSINGITNFQSINFMRMYMTGFSEEVILRMTEFQLISSNWIRFPGTLAEEGTVVTPIEESGTQFELGALSFEENSRKEPFNYVLPPGIIQQNINGNLASNVRQNERSLTLRTCNLEEGDARGIYKIVRQDLRQYKRLKMFVHGEPLDDGFGSNPNFEERGDAKVFIRLGLDNDENYYEYEMPLTPSNPLGGPSDPSNVWPLENEFDIDLALLAQAKGNRNAANFGLIYRYRDTTGLPEGHAIIVRGTPKLSDVRNIMIGVRNPEDPGGQPICLEVWVNELRLTNFDRKKGFAFNTNASFKLADLGTVNATASYKSAGFGPLEQKLSTRSQEENFRYNINANLSLDKFLPEKWGVSAPVSATYGEEQITPLFNPQEEDVTVDRLREILPPEVVQDTIRQIQDYRRSRSISLNNWKVNPGGAKTNSARPSARPTRPTRTPQKGKKEKQKAKMPWSISNFDFTFAYSEQEARNSTIQRQYNTQHRGAVNYRYNFPKVSLKPFKFMETSKFLQKNAGFLTRFELKPFPSNISVGVLGDRRFEERILRPIGLSETSIEPLFAKNFQLNRNYNLTWPLTRNLQLTFNAANTGRVDEVRGYWETASQRERDSIGTLRDNLLYIGKDTALGHDRYVNFGRNIGYQHNLNVAYKLPFSQIKILSWISGTLNYTATFNWLQAPEILPSQGGTITNNQTIQAVTRLDLNSVYRKVKPFQKILDGEKNFSKYLEPKEPKKKEEETKKPITPGKETKEEVAPKDTAKRIDPLWFPKRIAREVTRIALSVKNIDLNFNRTAGTILPGYLPSTDNFGLDWEYLNQGTQMFSGIVPPTWQFVFGGQQDVRGIAAENGWITQDTTLSKLFQQNVSDNLTARTSLELFKGFRIDLNANRTSTLNNSEYFRFDPATNGFNSFDPLTTGNLNMTYIFINSAFDPEDPELPSSRFLREFSNARTVISRRLAERDPEFANRDDETVFGFRNGYLGSNQDVLITSFLSAYGIVGPENIELSAQPLIPLPNWSINYNGLSQLPFIKDHFNSITLRHAYRSTYTVGTFNNNLLFRDFDMDGFADEFQLIDTFQTVGFNVFDTYSQFFIQGVQISESFSPLIGVSLTAKNGLQGTFEYKKSRQLTLNIGNLQVIETRNQDISFDLRYRKNKLNLFFRAFGRDFDLQNTANFALNVTYRQNYEVNRRLPGDRVGGPTDFIEQTTRGAATLILGPSIEYVANKRLNIKAFFDFNWNNPYTLATIETRFSSGGIQLRFSLAN